MKHLTIIFLSFFGSLLLGCQTDDMSSIAPVSTRPASVADDWSIPIVTIPPPR